MYIAIGREIFKRESLTYFHFVSDSILRIEFDLGKQNGYKDVSFTKSLQDDLKQDVINELTNILNAPTIKDNLETLLVNFIHDWQNEILNK